MNVSPKPVFPSAGLDCVRFVESFEALLGARFEGQVNAICWRRSLAGDFDEIMSVIGELDGITTLEENDLESLALSERGVAARKGLLEDLRLMRLAGLEPSLDCVPSYPRCDGRGPVPVDVYDFHADSATVAADSFLCSYTVACSEGVRNEEAIRYVDIPSVRAEVLREWGGADGADFEAYVRERFYDLHYTTRARAIPYSFGLGNLWRIATQYPGSPVPPCIHRAPTTREGDAARLLLIS